MRVTLSSDFGACFGYQFQALYPVFDEVEALSLEAAVHALVLLLGLNGPKLCVIRQILYNRPLLSHLLPVSSCSARCDIRVGRLNVGLASYDVVVDQRHSRLDLVSSRRLSRLLLLLRRVLAILDSVAYHSLFWLGQLLDDLLDLGKLAVGSRGLLRGVCDGHHE